MSWTRLLTSADSTNAVQDMVVDHLIGVDDVDREYDVNAELGELFADGVCRRLAESVHVRRGHYDCA